MFAQCEYPIYTSLGGREIAQFFGRHTANDFVRRVDLTFSNVAVTLIVIHRWTLKTPIFKSVKSTVVLDLEVDHRRGLKNDHLPFSRVWHNR